MFSYFRKREKQQQKITRHQKKKKKMEFNKNGKINTQNVQHRMLCKATISSHR